MIWSYAPKRRSHVATISDINSFSESGVHTLFGAMHPILLTQNETNRGWVSIFQTPSSNLVFHSPTGVWGSLTCNAAREKPRNARFPWKLTAEPAEN